MQRERRGLARLSANWGETKRGLEKQHDKIGTLLEDGDDCPLLAEVAFLHRTFCRRCFLTMRVTRGRNRVRSVAGCAGMGPCREPGGVSRIFLSHSSTNNAEAVALRDWLAENGWKDEIFLDLDPQRGIVAGERWERALNEAASRCEAVLFLVSRAWLNSGWCLKEFNLAHRLNKRLFGVLIEDLPVADLPVNLTNTWQLVRLATGRDHLMLRVVLPITHDEAHRNFGWERGIRSLG